MAKKDSKRYGARKRDPADEALDLEIAAVSARAKALQENILPLTSEEQTSFSQWLTPRVQAAENSAVREEEVSRITRMREYYLNGVPRTEMPMAGAHDHKTFLSAAQADAMKARIVGIWATDPVIRMEGRNASGVKNQMVAERFLDYHHDVNVSLPEKGGMTADYLTIEGHAVYYSPWTLEVDSDTPKLAHLQIYVRAEDGLGRKLVNVNRASEIQMAEQSGWVPKRPEEFEVTETKEPEIIKNYPDLKILSLLDYLHPENLKPGMKPQWEGFREWFTLDELLRMEESGQIYKGSLKKVKAYLENKPLEKEQGTKVSGQGNVVAEKPSFEKDALDSAIDTWVVWGKVKLPNKKYLCPAMVIFHSPSGTVLHTKLHPYFGAPSPGFHMRLVGVPFRFAGIGSMELSYEGDKAITDLVNYVMDETRIFSAIPYKYKRGRFPGGISPFEFWKGVAVKDQTDIQEFNPRDRRAMDLNVSTFIRANTERRVGIGDLQLGRESDVTGKQPPTARGIISILREGQVRFNLLNFTVINELVKWAAYEMDLFQQLAGEKTVIDAVGPEGKELFPQGLSRHQLLGRFKFIPNTTAQNLVRELDAELNLLIYDRFKDNIFFQKSMTTMYEMTRDVLISLGKKKTWLRPLSEYQKAAGFQPKDEELMNLSPEEQQFAEKLLATGLPMEAVKQQLAILRGEVPAAEVQVPEEETQSLVQTLIGGGGGPIPEGEGEAA